MISYRENIIFLFAKAHQRAQKALKGRLRAFGLTPMQCLVLEALWEEDGLPVGEIGRRIALDTATLAGVLDRMSTAGWVRRETDPDDGRVVQIYLTEKAQEVVSALASAIEVTSNELLSNFSIEEKLLFIRFLREVKD